nr:MAG TPA: hypothetical protein [Caudoviricetes sp.]
MPSSVYCNGRLVEISMLCISSISLQRSENRRV